MESIVEGIIAGLRRVLTDALQTARADGEIAFEQIPDFTVEVPREKGNGDFASNLAMLLARPARMAPRKIAEILVKHVDPNEVWLNYVEVAGPGFINFYLKPEWVYSVVPEIIREDENFGRVDEGRGLAVQVEFVSANPTGLLHMGNARGAALGDSIAAILAFAGFMVSREFYINDTGNQIENFGYSLEARYLQLLGRDVPFPEDGYHGEDIIATIRGYIQRYGDALLDTADQDRRATLTEFALREKLADIRNSLTDFGVDYDLWFHESSLHQSGAVEETLELLREQGHTYENEAATWLKSTAWGAEKDDVLVRSNGTPTYFLVDIAYHRDKYRRGFKRVIDIWGADHHGHVARMKGAAGAMGYDPASLEVVIMQLVRLYQGGELVRMSKRTGQFVTLDELVGEVGRDAARYFFVMRGADSHLDFDLDLAKSQSNENPVYYIQYAHARISSILRQWDGQNRSMPSPEEVDFNLLKEESEITLARKLADFPVEIATAAKSLAPQRIARYVHDLAGLLHSFYNANRVISDDEQLTKSRLILMNATRITLRNALKLLGLAAPEQM